MGIVSLIRTGDYSPSTAPAEPSGAEPVYQNDFEGYSLGNFGHDPSGLWTLTGTGDARLTVTDLLSRSGSKSARFRWGFGMSATVEMNFTHAPVQEYWNQFYLYFPDGSEGFSAPYRHNFPSGNLFNNKFYAFYADSYQSEPGGAFQSWGVAGSEGDVYVNVAATRGDMDGDLDLWRYPSNNPPAVINRGSLVNLATDLGHWIRFRIHLKVATQGVANGVMQLWKGDEVMVDVRNWPLYDEAGANTYLRAGYILGAASAGFTEDTSVLLDDLDVWYSDPGWGG